MPRKSNTPFFSSVLVSIIFLSCPFSVWAQTLKGRITDRKTGQPLEGATISVMDQRSGVFLKHALSNKSGQWSITHLPMGKPLEVIVSFSGYADTSAVFTLKDSASIQESGEWKLDVMTAELEKVTVSHRRPPFIVKKDTLEFDAKQFKTLPNDMVQDLLQKLPGMVVDAQGNVTVNGKPVDKIKVDGRDFFSGNLKAVTQNLPGTMIDKVQVTETREKGDENTTIVKPDKKSLTLNLTLKKENKKTFFGKVQAAGGGDGSKGLYSANTMLNTFNNERRYSLMAAIENIGGVRGGMSSLDDGMFMFSPEPGISRRGWGAGLSVKDKMGKKGQLDLTYGMDDNVRYAENGLQRQNFLPDSTFFYNSMGSSTPHKQNHYLSGTIDLSPDSLQHLTIRPDLRYERDDITSDQLSSSTSPGGIPINGQRTHALERNHIFSFANSMRYTIDSKDSQSHLTIDLSTAIDQTLGKKQNYSRDVFYTGGDSTISVFDQASNVSNRSYKNTLGIAFKHNFSPKWGGMFKYGNVLSTQYQNTDVFNYNPVSGLHDLPDSAYTNHSKNTEVSHIPEATVGYTGKSLSIEAGTALSIQSRQNYLLLKDSSVKVQQRNWIPEIRLSYAWNKHLNQSLSWNAMAEPPSPSQLAPAPDNSNPLVVKLGSPLLKAQVMHLIINNFEYNRPESQVMIYMSTMVQLMQHKIVDNIYYDTAGRQVASYANVEHNYNGEYSLNVSKGFTINDWKLQLSIFNILGNEISTALVNQQQNTSHLTKWSLNLSPGVNYKEVLSANLVYQLSFSRTTYSLAGILPQDYVTSFAGGSVNIRPLKGLKLNNMFFYTYNSQLPENLGRSRTTWNASLEYAMLKDQRLTASFMVNNVLNANNNVQRTISASAIETSTTNMLHRYCLVVVKYRLSRFSGPDGN